MEPVSSSTADLWRGRSAADRAADRRERLLAAALESLGTVGCAATTVRGVCRGAGVSLRYFYESFPGLDPLLIAAYDRVADELTAVVLRAIAAPDPQTRVRSAFAAAMDFIEADPRRGRILFRETLASDVLRDHGAATVPGFVSLVAASLTGAAPDGPAPAMRTARISALSGALVALFLDWQSGTLTLGKAELADYCAELTAVIFAGG